MSLSHFIPTLEVIAAIGVALRWSPAAKCHAVWDVGAPCNSLHSPSQVAPSPEVTMATCLRKHSNKHTADVEMKKIEAG